MGDGVGRVQSLFDIALVVLFDEIMRLRRALRAKQDAINALEERLEESR